MFEKEKKMAVTAVTLVAIVQLSVLAGSLFLVGSLVTSGVKAVSGQCGKVFGVPVVSQDWFCAK